jgi:ribose transport system ATP-binding protein
MTAPLLEARAIRKTFPGVLALDGVSLSLSAGEVLAVVGENGAGKSTLMKILAGVYTPDSGELLLDGHPVRFGRVSDAMKAGISLIHQELNLAENLSVAANIYLGREITRWGPLAWLDSRAMNDGAKLLLDRVGLDVSPGTRVGTLTPGQRQLIEIARSLGMQARVLIMDEPTSSLTQGETDRLFEVIRDLKASRVAVVYISHRLAEVQEVADRVTVLRDGRNAGDLAASEISRDALVQRMVGRDLKQLYPRVARSIPGQVRLEVRDLLFDGGGPVPISFAVHAGEVVGMAGLVGAGRTELSEALFGLRRLRAGTILLDGQNVPLGTPRRAIQAGLLLVPEDRRHHGLLLLDSIRRNIALPNLDQISRWWLLNFAAESALAQSASDKLRIKASSTAQPAGQLSGGNQQKVVLGKWLARQPRVLILDEPTRGVDVGARGEIYALIDQLAGSGVAVLMISSDMEEVLGMSDRVLVLHEGVLTGNLPRDKMTETEIMHRATGTTE